jgi:hypothetical protein
LKHATTLRASGFSSDSALAQADLDYQKLNIGSQVASHFTAPFEQYSVQEFIDFIMDAQVCFLTYLLRDYLIQLIALQIICNELPYCTRVHNTEDEDGP